MRISKYIKPIGFLIVLFCVNAGLSFLFVPANGASESMWDAYGQEEELDLLFMGASIASASFDPLIIDKELCVKSFNMGTPSQAIVQTKNALERAVSEHEIKTVVFAMDFFSLQQGVSSRAALTFENAKAEQGNGIVEGIRYMCSEGVRDTEDSVNYLFPWLYNHVSVSWSSIAENVEQKLQPAVEVFEANSTERRDWLLEKGYRPYTGQDSYVDMWWVNSYYTYPQQFDDEAIGDFQKFMEFCNKKEIELIVVNVPNPTYDVISCCDTYLENDGYIRSLCAGYNAEYYDFSLVKPDLFEPKPEYFYNFEHLNYQGSQEFSKAFCHLMQERDENGYISGYFYTVEDFFELHEQLVKEWKQVQM